MTRLEALGFWAVAAASGAAGLIGIATAPNETAAAIIGCLFFSIGAPHAMVALLLPRWKE